MTVRPAPIELAIETPAAPGVAWKAITEPARIAEWFTDASPLGMPGDPYRLDFGDSAVEGVILRVEPGSRFAHTWSWEGQDTGAATIVEWWVEPLPSGGSRVRLEHSGWPDTTPDDTSRDDHLGYWTAYLEDLTALLTG